MKNDIRKEFSDVIYPKMVIRSQAETIELQEKEIERLNNIIEEIEKYAGLGELNWEDNYQDIMLSGKGLLKRIKELKGNNNEKDK